jgi:uncharacterized NAD(P)/FAD-binding protein YdhS
VPRVAFRTLVSFPVAASAFLARHTVFNENPFRVIDRRPAVAVQKEDDMQRYKLIIVGAGPRSLGVLERLNAICATVNPAWGLDVHLIDPAEPGQGSHPGGQPDYLLTNTVAAQITMFSDRSVQNAGPISKGPSLQEWANLVGYRCVDGHFVKTSSDGREVHENDYLPRSFLGEYLSFVFDHIATHLHRSIRLRHYRSEAVNINFLANDQVIVQLEGGFSIVGDFAILTTGHSRNRPSTEDQRLASLVSCHLAENPCLDYINHAYPLSAVQSISRDAVVGLQGIGLSAYDIISCLTEGRGGRFDPSGKRRLVYRPSGREPKIVAFSRQGLPFCSRAVNEKGVSGQVQPKFLTRARIDQLRMASIRHGHNGRLDFEQDLWPVLLKEMCFAYHSARTGVTPMFPAAYEPDPDELAAIDRIVAPLGGRQFTGTTDFSAAVRAYLEQDLADAFGGNVSNPVKAATDILRDVRDNIRYAVDFCGLTPESHQRFLQDFCPLMNRIAVGPPKERNMQLLALMDAGIVTLGAGPAPDVQFDEAQSRFVMTSTTLAEPERQHFDVLVRARLDSFHPQNDTSAFIVNALANGVVRPYRNGDFQPGGIDVNRSQNIVDAQGRVHANVWALGNIAEGANFYTYVLPRPMVNSRFIQDAGRCVLGILQLAASRDVRHSQPAEQLIA